MPRLIDADVLMSRIENSARNAGLHSEDYRKIKRFIATTPTIDAEPVRHGRWIRLDDTFTSWQCSACGTKYNSICWPYCSHCGAKMDAKDNDVPTKPEAHRPEDCVYYATRQRDGWAVCLGTRELDPCDGAGCKRWKTKGEKK